MEIKLTLTELQPLKLSHIGQLLIDRALSLCNHLLSHFSMESFQTWHTFSKCIEDLHLKFG